MKKFLILLSLTMTVIFNSVFASGEPKVDQRVLNSFKKEFSFVKEVQWTVGRDYVRATFVMGEKPVSAFFLPDGSLLAVARNLLYDELPIAVIQALNKQYAGVALEEIFEYNKSGETFYYFTIERGRYKLRMKATASGELIVEKKSRK